MWLAQGGGPRSLCSPGFPGDRTACTWAAASPPPRPAKLAGLLGSKAVPVWTEGWGPALTGPPKRCHGNRRTVEGRGDGMQARPLTHSGSSDLGPEAGIR